MKNGTMAIAQKAVTARARYEAVKVEFTNANRALQNAKFAMIEACNDVNEHWQIVCLASRIVEKEAVTTATHCRLQWYGVWCDQAELAASRHHSSADGHRHGAGK